jgi:hypothetical protein
MKGKRIALITGKENFVLVGSGQLDSLDIKDLADTLAGAGFEVTIFRASDKQTLNTYAAVRNAVILSGGVPRKVWQHFETWAGS